MKISNKILAVVFVAILAVTTIVNAVLPDREYSESEKRELQLWPEFSAQRVFNGSFTKEFDQYANDQFMARDTWVQAKGMSQYFSGKRELNGVYITGDRYMGDFKVDQPERLEKNLQAIRSFAEKSEVPVYLLMIPESIGIYGDELPAFASPDDQDALAQKVKKQLGDHVTTVWPKETLMQNRDEYIYYRTDHHWTPLGALYGYRELQKATGKGQAPLTDFSPVNDAFKGSMLFKAGLTLPWIEPDVLQRPEQYDNSDFSVTVDDGKGDRDGLMFDESHLKGEDKYRYYQGGNQPLMAIASGTGTGKALVLKDSFCNVMMPYLAADYETIYVADLRFNRMSMNQYAKDMQVDQIILVYSASSLCSENSISQLEK